MGLKNLSENKQFSPPQVVTLGETMLRLSPTTVSTLEETQQLQVHVGGG